MPDPTSESQSTPSASREIAEGLWHARPAGAVLASLGTDGARGLADAEARRRFARDGPNELTAEPPVPAWRRFLAQFESVLVLLLLSATVISLALWFLERDAALPYDAIAILAIVLLNATLGLRAGGARGAGRRRVAVDVRRRGDGDPRRRASAHSRPRARRGRLVLLEEGDTVPADARVLESIALRSSEAALTGESQPVDKTTDAVEADAALGDRVNMVFSGTAITYGRGRARRRRHGDAHRDGTRRRNARSRPRTSPRRCSASSITSASCSAWSSWRSPSR